jgi:hypothetical protein
METLMLKNCALLVVLCLTGACVPRHLEKYRTKDAAPAGGSPTSAQRVVDPITTNDRAPIRMIDQQTFRFHLRSESVWKAAIDVLIKNYNITMLNRETGLMTTEWDSFYLENKLYRNRVSLHFKRLSWDIVDVTVMNNVETMGFAEDGQLTNIWLPSEDQAGESMRIVNNMARLLNQPLPSVLTSQGPIAADGTKEASSTNEM